MRRIIAVLAIVGAAFVPSAHAGSSPVKCNQGDSYVKVMDITGHLVKEFEYHLTYIWCFTPRRIVSIKDVYAYGNGTFPWSFKGNLPGSPSYDARPNCYYAVIFSQASFEATLFKLGIRTRQPWIRVTLAADGRVRTEWSKG